MTVETSDRKQSFAGTQSTLTFTFKTLVDYPEYIKVKNILTSTGAETDLTYNTDYTVSLNDNGVGGTVTLTVTVSTLYTTTVYRETTDTQESDYEDYNQFPADTLEADLDRRTLVNQETSEEIDRAIKLPISSSLSGLELPAPSASTVIGWNASADGLSNYSNAAQSVTDAANYASTASTQATNAANYATSASTQATAAGNYATSASTSAVDAAASAASVNLPSLSGSTVGELLTVNAATDGYELVKTVSTDGTLVANSDDLIPTQKAVKTYADSLSFTPCYFSAYLSAAQTNIAVSENVTVLFNTETFDQGGNFNVGTYTFTAPATGIYQLNVSLAFKEIDSNGSSITAYLVTSNKTYQIVGWDTTIMVEDNDVPIVFSSSTLADMDINDTAYVRVNQGGGAQQVDIEVSGSYFSGVRIA